MELYDLEAQAQACVESYRQLSDLIKEHNHSHHPQQQQSSVTMIEDLIRTRKNILSMLFTLHSHLNISSPIENRLEIGSVCYAPRLIERTLDLAFIVSKDDDGIFCSICWIYPRNIYELSSTGMRIDIDRLKPLSEERNSERILSLQNLTQDSLVLVQNDRGIFVSGRVSKRLIRGLSFTNEKLLEIVSENPLTSRITTFTFPEDILLVTPHSFDHPSSDLQFTNESLDSELIENDIPGYTTQSISGSKHLQTSGDFLCDWERHTKGFGSKLLEKMGYRRGEGLGKWGQGRVKPIEPNAALPQGISLDFIHDTPEVNSGPTKKKKKSKSENSGLQKTFHPDVFDFINATCGTSDRDNPQQEELTKSILCPPKSSQDILEIGDNESKLKGKMVKLQQSLQRNVGKDMGLCERLMEQIREIEKELISVRAAQNAIVSNLGRKTLKEKTNIKKVF